METKKVWKKKPREEKTTKIEQFPPPFSKRKQTLRKLIEVFGVQENPDPAPCETCGLEYRDFHTGLDFQAVKDMLWVADNDPKFWKHKGRHTILGLWFQIKRTMWQDHIELCKDVKGQKSWLSDWSDKDFEY